MSQTSYPDVCIIPGTGIPGQSLNDIVCGAPRGAKDQLTHVLYTGNRVPGPNGSGEYNILTNRYNQPYITVVVG